MAQRVTLFWILGPGLVFLKHSSVRGRALNSAHVVEWPCSFDQWNAWSDDFQCEPKCWEMRNVSSCCGSFSWAMKKIPRKNGKQSRAAPAPAAHFRASPLASSSGILTMPPQYHINQMPLVHILNTNLWRMNSFEDSSRKEQRIYSKGTKMWVEGRTHL